MGAPHWASSVLDSCLRRIPFLAAVQAVAPAHIPRGIQVHLLELALQQGSLPALLSLLPGPEQERCLRYRRPADRIRFATTRVVLRRLLAQRLRVAAQDIEFAMGAFGKPGLPHGVPLFFNVSHAGGFALIALSAQGPVGVDIEATARMPDTSPVHLGFTPDEQRYCDRTADAHAFLRVWSGKEAVLKALGLGIGQHLPSVSVIPGPAGHYAVSPHGAGFPLPPQAWQLPAPPGFVAALALLQPVAAVLGQEPEVAAKCG